MADEKPDSASLAEWDAEIALGGDTDRAVRGGACEQKVVQGRDLQVRSRCPFEC
ncbi:hypothetical protein NWFMUON74_56940 [Nocardia wallacei]|uniref:Uncharacterized protein n=1 Tax=Nocardia wallacei TaxID=480035 RepID=A0A7G1KRZ4_9NOCA|nr:hypothetical protein NWFMUON74_56940 [Nocardia wallacei]